MSADRMLAALRSRLKPLIGHTHAREMAGQLASLLKDPRVRPLTVARLEAALSDGRRGYLAMKKLVDAEPNRPAYWVVLAIKADELGYSNKRQFALLRAQELLATARGPQASAARLHSADAGQRRLVCSICGGAAMYELPGTAAVCSGCVKKVVAFIERGPRDELRAVWRLSANFPPEKVDEVRKRSADFARMDGGLAAQQPFVARFLSLPSPDLAVHLLAAVVGRHLDAEPTELSPILALLFDERAVRPDGMRTLARVLPTHAAT